MDTLYINHQINMDLKLGFVQQSLSSACWPKHCLRILRVHMSPIPKMS